MNGNQAGDPAKLARALVELVEQKARLLLTQVDAHRALSTSLAHDDARVAA